MIDSKQQGAVELRQKLQIAETFLESLECADDSCEHDCHSAMLAIQEVSAALAAKDEELLAANAHCEDRVQALKSLDKLILDGALAVQHKIAAERDALRVTNAWISVEEKLPAPKTRVLAYTQQGVQIGTYVPDCTCSAKWHIRGNAKVPTHWRPLPQPPAHRS